MISNIVVAIVFVLMVLLVINKSRIEKYLNSKDSYLHRVATNALAGLFIISALFIIGVVSYYSWKWSHTQYVYIMNK